MAYNDDSVCETCGQYVDELFTYALPGIPLSVSNCHNCFRANAYPLAIAKANTEVIGGLALAAQWWRESITYVLGKGYTPIEVALRDA
jgi:hypothetical protein